MHDNLLIHQIQSGNRQAFDALVRRHYQNIFSYCFRKTGDREIAADLTQEVFLRLVEAIYRYRYTGKFQNYLFTVAVNICTDYYRKKRPDTDDSAAELPDIDAAPDEILLSNESVRQLHGYIRRLPEAQRDAVILYYFHDLRAKDIAQITGISLPCAKSRIRQGVIKLKKAYEEDENRENQTK